MYTRASAEATGLAKHGSEVVRLRKAICGLINTPLGWFDKYKKEMKTLSFAVCVLKPCVWRLADGDVCVAVACLHVDHLWNSWSKIEISSFITGRLL